MAILLVNCDSALYFFKNIDYYIFITRRGVINEKYCAWIL